MLGLKKVLQWTAILLFFVVTLAAAQDDWGGRDVDEPSRFREPSFLANKATVRTIAEGGERDNTEDYDSPETSDDQQHKTEDDHKVVVDDRKEKEKTSDSDKVVVDQENTETSLPDGNEASLPDGNEASLPDGNDDDGGRDVDDDTQVRYEGKDGPVSEQNNGDDSNGASVEAAKVDDKKQTVVDDARNSAQESVKDAKEQGEKAVEDAKKQGEKAVEDAKAQAEQAQEEGEKAIKDAQSQGQQAVEDAKNQAEQAKAEGQKAVQDAKAQAQKAVEDVKQQAEQAKEQVKNVRENADKMMKDAKQQAIDGAKNAAKNAIKGVCSKPIKLNDDIEVEFDNKEKCVDYPELSGGITVRAMGKTFTGKVSLEKDTQKFSGACTLPEFTEPFGVKGFKLNTVELSIDLNLEEQGIKRLKKFNFCGGAEFAKGSDMESKIDVCVDLDIDSKQYKVSTRNGPFKVRGQKILDSLSIQVAKAGNGWAIKGQVSGVSLAAMFAVAGAKSTPKQLPKDVVFESVTVNIDTSKNVFSIAGEVTVKTDQDFVGLRLKTIKASIVRKSEGAPLDVKLAMTTGETKLMDEAILNPSSVDVAWVDQKLDVKVNLAAKILGYGIQLDGKLEQSTKLQLGGGTAQGALWKNLFGMKGLTAGEVRVDVELDSEASPRLRSLKICGDLVVGQASAGTPGLSMCLDADPVEKKFSVSSKKSPMTFKGAQLLTALSLHVAKAGNGRTIKGQVSGVSLAAMFSVAGAKSTPKQLPKDVVFESVNVDIDTSKKVFAIAGEVRVNGGKDFVGLQLETIKASVVRKSEGAPLDIKLAMTTGVTKLMDEHAILNPSSIDVAWVNQKLDVKLNLAAKILGYGIQLDGKLEQSTKLQLGGGTAQGALWKNLFGMKGLTAGEVRVDAELDSEATPRLRSLKICGDLVVGQVQAGDHGISLCIDADPVKKVFSVRSKNSPMKFKQAELLKTIEIQLEKLPDPVGWSFSGKVTGLVPNGFVSAFMQAMNSKKKVPSVVPKGIVIEHLKVQGNTATNAWTAAGKIDFSSAKPIKGLGQLKLKSIDFEVGREDRANPPYFIMDLKLSKLVPFPDLSIVDPSQIRVEYLNKEFKVEGQMRVEVFKTAFELKGRYEQNALALKGGLAPGAERWNRPLGVPGFFMKELTADLSFEFKKKPPLQYLKVCGSGGFMKSPSKDLPLCVEANVAKMSYEVFANGPNRHLSIGAAHLANELALKAKKEGKSWDLKGSLLELQVLVLVRTLAGDKAEGLPVPIKPGTIVRVLKVDAQTKSGQFRAQGTIAFKRGQKVIGLTVKELGIVVSRDNKLKPIDISFAAKLGKTKLIDQVYINPSELNFHWKNREWKADAKMSASIFGKTVNLEGEATKTWMKLKASIPKDEKWGDFFGFKGIEVSNVNIDLHLDQAAIPKLVKLNFCGKLAFGEAREVYLGICVEALPRKGIFRIYPQVKPMRIGIPKLPPLAFDIDFTLKRLNMPDMSLPNVKLPSAPKFGGFGFKGMFVKLNLKSFMIAIFRITAPTLNIDLPDFLPTPLVLPKLSLGTLPKFPGAGFKAFGELEFPKLTAPSIFGLKIPSFSLDVGKIPKVGLNFALKFKTLDWSLPGLPEIKFGAGLFDIGWKSPKLNVDIQIPLIFFNYRLDLRGVMKGPNIRLSVKMPAFEMPELFGLRGIFRLEDVSASAVFKKVKPHLVELKVCGRGILLDNALTNENQLNLCVEADLRAKSFRIYNINGPIELEKIKVADKVDLTVSRLSPGYRIQGMVKGVEIHKMLNALLKKAGTELPPVLPKGFALNALKVDANTHTKAFNIEGDVTTNFKLGGIEVSRVAFMVDHKKGQPRPAFGVKLYLRGALFEDNLVIEPSVLSLENNGKNWAASGDIKTRLFKKRTFTIVASLKHSPKRTKVTFLAKLDSPWSVFDIEGAGALRLETVGITMLIVKGKGTRWGVLCEGGFSIDTKPFAASFDGRLELQKAKKGLELRLTAKKPISVGFPVPMPSVKPDPTIKILITSAALALKARTCELAGSVTATGFPVLGSQAQNVNATVAIGAGKVRVTVVGFKIKSKVDLPPGGETKFGQLHYSLGPLAFDIESGGMAAKADFAVGLPPEINTFFAGTEVFLPYKGTPETMVRGEIGYHSKNGAYCRIKSRFLSVMKAVKAPPAAVLAQMAQEKAKEVGTAAVAKVEDKALEAGQQAVEDVKNSGDMLAQIQFRDKDDPDAEWVGMNVPHIGEIHMVLPTFVYQPDQMKYMAKGDVYFPKGLSIPFGFFKKLLKKKSATRWAAAFVPKDYKLKEFRLFKKNGQPVSPMGAVKKLNGLSRKTFGKPMPSFVSKIVRTVWKTLNLQNMPPAWKPHMRVAVPNRCKYYFKYTPPAGVGNVEFAFDFKGEELAFVSPMGFALVGAKIRYISAGAIMGGQAMIVRVDADVQVMDLATMGMALVLPKGFLPTENSHFDVYLHNVTTLIHPATAGIPVPVFWDKLGWKFDILGGFRSEVTMSFPQPNLAPPKMLKLMKEFFTFCKDPKYFFPVPETQTDDGATKGSQADGIDLNLTIGKVYFMLPKWLGGIAIGDPNKGGDSISAKGMLNALKKRRLDLVIEMLPFRLRAVTAGFEFLGIGLKASVAISTTKELRAMIRDDAPAVYMGKFRDYVRSLNSERRASFIKLTTVKTPGAKKGALKTSSKPVFLLGAGEWKFSPLAAFSIEVAWGLSIANDKLDVQAGFGMRGSMFAIIEVAISGKIWLSADTKNPKQPPGLAADGKAEIRIFNHPVLTGTANYTTANGGGLGVSLEANLFPDDFPIICRGAVGGVFSKEKIQVEGGVKLAIRFLPALSFGDVHLFMNPDVGLTVTAKVLNAKAVMHMTKTGVKIEMSDMGLKPLLYIHGKSSMGGPILIIDTGKDLSKSPSNPKPEAQSSMQREEIQQQEAEIARNPSKAPIGVQDILLQDDLVRRSNMSYGDSLLQVNARNSGGPHAYMQGAFTILGMTREVEAELTKQGATITVKGDFLGLISAEAVVKTGPKFLEEPGKVDFEVNIETSAFLNEVLKPLGAMLDTYEKVVKGFEMTYKTTKQLFENMKRGLLIGYIAMRELAIKTYSALKEVKDKLGKLGVDMGELPPDPARALPKDPFQEAEAGTGADTLLQLNVYADNLIARLDQTNANLLATSDNLVQTMWFSKLKKKAKKALNKLKKGAKKLVRVTIGPLKRKFKQLLNKTKDKMKEAMKQAKEVAKNKAILALIAKMKDLKKKIDKAVKYIADNIPRPSALAIRKVRIASNLRALEGSAKLEVAIDVGVSGKEKQISLTIDVNIKDLGALAKQCFKSVLQLFKS